MMKAVNRIILTAAAASMTVLPVAAQANTRAGDNGAIYSTSTPGLGRTADGEEVGGSGVSIILAILAAAAVIGGIIIAADPNDDSQSPGT